MGEARLTARQRQEAHERARGCCEYCRSQLEFAMQPFAVDHVVPRSQGGATDGDNLALACAGCNAHKYNKVRGVDPVTGESVPLFHPRRDAWAQHFAWNGDFAHILGVTPTGRATVETLKLNREGVVNLRRVLHAAGRHPPGDPGSAER